MVSKEYQCVRYQTTFLTAASPINNIHDADTHAPIHHITQIFASYGTRTHDRWLCSSKREPLGQDMTSLVSWQCKCFSDAAKFCVN